MEDGLAGLEHALEVGAAHAAAASTSEAPRHLGERVVEARVRRGHLAVLVAAEGRRIAADRLTDLGEGLVEADAAVDAHGAGHG